MAESKKNYKVALQCPATSGGHVIKTTTVSLSAGTITAASKHEDVKALVGKAGRVEIVSVTPV